MNKLRLHFSYSDGLGQTLWFAVDIELTGWHRDYDDDIEALAHAMYPNLHFVHFEELE